LDVIHPAENADLARDIARQGARLSEQPFGRSARAGFPASQSHRFRLGAGGDRDRGRDVLGLSDYGALRARPGARGDGGAGAPDGQPRVGGEYPDPGWNR